MGVIRQKEKSSGKVMRYEKSDSEEECLRIDKKKSLRKRYVDK